VIKRNLRQHLEKSCLDQELRQWFDPLEMEVREHEKSLHVRFPHSFFADWFASTAQSKFEEQVRLFLGPGYVLRYLNTNCSPITANAHETEKKAIDFPFGHKFTFENFIINKKNGFPLATAKEVAKNNEVVFNPFIITGGNGYGKTHLLKSIANEISKKYNNDLIFFGNIESLYNIYTSDFKNDFFKARTYLYKFHFIFIDEFQLIKKYSNFQQELINIFNNFYDNKKQMIFCCSDKLALYEFLDPKLKSRLEWGLIVNLKKPDLNIRVQYIEKSCKEKKINISKEQMLTLAQRFDDLRFIQGLLLKIYAYMEFVKKDLSDNDFRHILSQTTGQPKKRIRPEIILDAAAEHFKVERKDLMGTRRHHHIVLARQTAMYLCRELVGSSYPSLGRIFGGRDHSTALYAVKKIKQLQKDNKDIKNMVNLLKKKCLVKCEV